MRVFGSPPWLLCVLLFCFLHCHSRVLHSATFCNFFWSQAAHLHKGCYLLPGRGLRRKLYSTPHCFDFFVRLRQEAEEYVRSLSTAFFCNVFLSCSFAPHHTVVDQFRLFNTLHVGSASGQTRDRRVNAHGSFIEPLALANNLQLHVCISSNPPGVTLVPGVHDRGLQKGDIPFRPTF